MIIQARQWEGSRFVGLRQAAPLPTRWAWVVAFFLRSLRSFAAIHSFMRIYYITLNTDDEARRISRALLEQQLAVCTNWFPITCAYRWDGKIVEEPETVLLVKTQADYRAAIEKVVRQHISYTNLMAEIAPESVNDSFAKWLNAEVPLAANRKKE